MLARSYRLPAQTRLNRPVSYHSPLFTLKFASSSSPHSRCSVLISKAVDKRASKRNELRRVILRTVRPFLHTLIKPYDLLFILKKQAVIATQDELISQTRQSLEKVVSL